MLCGVNALATTRRSRVWSGGSRSNVDSPPERVEQECATLLRRTLAGLRQPAGR